MVTFKFSASYEKHYSLAEAKSPRYLKNNMAMDSHVKVNFNDFRGFQNFFGILISNTFYTEKLTFKHNWLFRTLEALNMTLSEAFDPLFHMNHTCAGLRCHSKCFERLSHIVKLGMLVGMGLNFQYISKAVTSKVWK